MMITSATVRNLLSAMLAALALSAPVGARPQPPDTRAVASSAYTVEIAGQPVFTEKFRDVNFAAWRFTGTVEVSVTAHEPVRDFNISPHSAGIAATAVGSILRFKLDRPRHLVVTVNGGEKHFLFADPPDPGAPRPGDPGVFNVLDFGIDATGARLETARLQQAIDRVAAAKGTLYFPPGVYLSGMLSLKSDLTLHLAEGARLLASDNPADFPVDEGFDEANIRHDPALWVKAGGSDVAYRQFILVDGAHNVRVSGPGIIEGRGRILRPLKNIMFVVVRSSSDVEFDGVTLLDSPMYNVHLLASDHVTLRRVKIVSDQEVHNTDGIDPNSSRDVLVEDCFVFTGDDCIAIKTSGQNRLGGDAGRITVRNCVLTSRTSGIKLGTETFAGAHSDILFDDNDILEADRAINLSSEDGHGFERIRLIGLRVERLLGRRVQFPVHIHVERRHPQGAAGRIHDVLLQDISIAEEYSSPSRLDGLSPEHDVRGIRFVNYKVAGRVRLDADDANVKIGPFVSDVTFTAQP